jgi:hypothetical protein
MRLVSASTVLGSANGGAIGANVAGCGTRYVAGWWRWPGGGRPGRRRAPGGQRAQVSLAVVGLPFLDGHEQGGDDRGGDGPDLQVVGGHSEPVGKELGHPGRPAGLLLARAWLQRRGAEGQLDALQRCSRSWASKAARPSTTPRRSASTAGSSSGRPATNSASMGWYTQRVPMLRWRRSGKAKGLVGDQALLVEAGRLELPCLVIRVCPPSPATTAEFGFWPARTTLRKGADHHSTLRAVSLLGVAPPLGGPAPGDPAAERGLGSI